MSLNDDPSLVGKRDRRPEFDNSRDDLESFSLLPELTFLRLEVDLNKCSNENWRGILIMFNPKLAKIELSFKQTFFILCAMFGSTKVRVIKNVKI